MKTKLLGLLAIAFILTASALTVSAQLDLPKMPHKKEPAGALPDLRIESAVFRFSSVDVVIKNTGNGTSPAAQLVIDVYATTEPSSAVKWILYSPDIPSLAPGKVYKTNVKVGFTSLTLNGHARRIVIDPHNLVAESDKRNNRLFSNAQPEADEGSFPEPGGFDLSFTTVKFISPGKVHFCVQNAGPAESGPFQVKTTIFKGPEKTSGESKTITGPFASLAAGQTKCDDFLFEANPGEEVFVGRGRLIEILSTGSDYNKTNNSYFEPAEQAPWSH